MPERATVAQVFQIGPETVPGTSVAASKRLASLAFTPGIQVGTNPFRGGGYKYQSLVTLGREWSSAGISGPATYTELQYLLNSVLQEVTPTASGTTGQLWAYAPSSTTEDTVRTYTVEHGSATRADKWTYGLVTDFQINFNRDEVTVGGTMVGRALQDAITLTGAPTAIPLRPILGKQCSVYVDSTGAGLGTTKLLRNFSGGIQVNNRFNPVWVVDAAQSSFVSHVETPPDAQFTMRVAADAQGMGFLTSLRAGQTQFLRFEAVGAVIGAGPATDKFTFDVAGQISGVSNFDDQDGVQVVEWTLGVVHDGTWGKALAASLINDRTAL